MVTSEFCRGIVPRTFEDRLTRVGRRLHRLSLARRRTLGQREFSQDYYIQAAILGSPSGRRIAGDWIIFSVAGSREPLRGELILRNQYANQLCRAPSGQLPI